MAIGITRPTRAIVDCQAIYENVKNEMKQYDDNTELFAVVKANGYGHGAIQVAEAARAGGATGFCVALLDEALELREAGFKEPILILGLVSADYLDVVTKYKLSVMAFSNLWLEQARLAHQKKECLQPVKIHVKIDSGMGRIGLRTTLEMEQALQLIEENPEVFELEGICTHFAKADTADTDYFHLQQTRFSQALDLFPTKDIRYIHTANSATALWHDHWQSNLVRFGIAMYGQNPSGRELTAPYELKPALSLETELIQVKKLVAGEHVGYGAEYEVSAPQGEWIGTIPLGYADGFIRAYKGFKVLVNGEWCQIVGRVCMDQCMIRLNREVTVGTKVTIFGENGNEYSSIQAAADYLGTIAYEVTCLLGERIPREYVNRKYR